MPETDDTTTEDTTTDTTSKPPSIEEMLADLDDTSKSAVLGALSKARKEAAGYRTRVKELEPIAAAAQASADAQKTAEERAQGIADLATQRADQMVQRAVRAEVRAHAAADFADPDDAAAFLNLNSYVDALGDVDEQQIRADLADLLARKPHLAKTAPGERRPPRPDASQASGSRGSAALDPAREFGAFIQAQTR